MKYESIKKNKDFLRAYKNGKKVVSNLVVLYKVKNSTGDKRIGITTSKKVGKAVVRNRVRRLIRESVYCNFLKLSDGYDYVIVARNKSAGSSYTEVLKNVSYAIRKI